MQNLKLPITIDPFRSAQRRLVCEGVFDSLDMDRLLSTCKPCTEKINVSFTFSVDELGLTVMSGKSSTSVMLTCQRCNEELEQVLEANFTFSPVKKSEDVAELPSYYDAIELDENGEVNLRELVEEEFLLAIPLIPRHQIKDCHASADSVWGELPDELEKPNPFDVLKQIK